MNTSEGDPDLIWNQEQFIEMIKTDDEFAKKWGELGPIYGRQWRNWNAIFDGGVDQITNLINDLKNNPDSRRLMVNAWNVGELNQMLLPPCHYGFQIYTRELSWEERSKLLDTTEGPWDSIATITTAMDKQKLPKRAISLMWNQRSVDTFLGLPFNIASYALLLKIIAKEVNMVPDQLIGNLGDVHLYSNHIEQAKEQLTRQPFQLPELWCLDEYHYLTDEELVGPIPFNEKIEEFRPDFFTMHNYEAHPHIKAPLSN
jgi:thymidylate synthase